MEPVPETAAVLAELTRQGDPEAAVTLMRMGRRAQEIVPECVGLSVGVIEDGLTFTLVASDEQSAAIDAVQYLDGGPCVAARDRLEPLHVSREDLLDESRWLLYAQATAAAGIASSLSLPLVRDGVVVGGVNLYASTSDAFRDHHEALAAALGGSALGAVTNADLSFSTRLRAAEAVSRLADEDDVAVALGIIAVSQDVDITTARERLRTAAARAGITEAQAARALRHIRTS